MRKHLYYNRLDNLFSNHNMRFQCVQFIGSYTSECKDILLLLSCKKEIWFFCVKQSTWKRIPTATAHKPLLQENVKNIYDKS